MKKGFTLIELLLIIALFLIIGISSSVFYTRFLMQNAVVTTDDQLISTLRKAQWYAVMEKNGGAWGVHIDSDRIVLFQGDSYGNRVTSLDENLSVYNLVNISAPNDVLFVKRTGSIDADIYITVSGGNELRTISINKQGIVN